MQQQQQQQQPQQLQQIHSLHQHLSSQNNANSLGLVNGNSVVGNGSLSGLNSLTANLVHQSNNLVGLGLGSVNNGANNASLNGTPVTNGSNSNQPPAPHNINNLLLVQQLLSSSLPQLQNQATLAAVTGSNSTNSGRCLFPFFNN